MVKMSVHDCVDIDMFSSVTFTLTVKTTGHYSVGRDSTIVKLTFWTTSIYYLLLITNYVLLLYVYTQVKWETTQETRKQASRSMCLTVMVYLNEQSHQTHSTQTHYADLDTGILGDRNS